VDVRLRGRHLEHRLLDTTLVGVFVPIVCCVVIWACTDTWNRLILTALNA
jgi:hypothetical protein